MVPAIDPDTFIKPNRPKRQIRSVKFTDCVAQNIIDRQVTNKTRSFAVPVSKTNQYRNSFFVDKKIFKEIYKTRDCEDSQKDMHLMHAWSEKWMLKFYPDKCKTMRIGRSKVEKHEYTLKADLKPIEETIAEKDQRRI